MIIEKQVDFMWNDPCRFHVEYPNAVFPLAAQLNATTAGNATSDHPYLPILGTSAVASVVMVACPNLLGSLCRIPAAILLEKYSTRTLHLIVMTISFIGTMGLMILSFATQHMGELPTSVYFGYLFFGTIGGLGKALQ